MYDKINYQSCFDKGKIIYYLVSILYTCFAFSCFFMLLCLFKCYRSILEGYGRNQLKCVENGQNWQKSRKQEKFWQTGRPVLDRGSALRRWSLAPRRQLLGNFILFPFSALQRQRNWANSFSNFFGYLRTSKTHLQGSKNTLTQKLRRESREE